MLLLKSFQMKILVLMLAMLLFGCHFKSTPEKTNGPKSPKSTEGISYVQKSSQLVDGPPQFEPEKQYLPTYPQYEPISRYGNRASYDVDGKQYNVMATSKGYRAKGLASWYGTKFHKKKTSSGEVYDLHAMTAAHKTLPLPTYVKVKNLENGRELLVKVNDRGPFHTDRIIDLSYAAAKKLGILAKGTGLVEIEAINPKGVVDVPLKYFIQTGAYSQKNKAEMRAESISSLIQKPAFVEFHNQLYIVKTGPFETQVELQHYKQKLAKIGYQKTFTVLQKPNLQDNS